MVARRLNCQVGTRVTLERKLSELIDSFQSAANFPSRYRAKQIAQRHHSAHSSAFIPNEVPVSDLAGATCIREL
jgi:hypothetical protein